ncbi:hypothetical protein LIS77_22915 [Cytobacillus firmus]|uniref:lipopolysaccharide biosynthesis protein n=1 Tax=Cytobacillus firmus TaxID=1399 RepID=UPI00207ADDE8|nr:hypothetical protein [Cytobacillus firmus]USK38700.1 hypothetical protein LIS77_22915 [Cytobacillus firmus]
MLINLRNIKKILAEEKNRQVFFNTIGAFGVRGMSLIISLLTMPAYMKFFDNQNVLGLWFTVLSVLSWILNFDLGIGNGLRNRLVFSLENKDYLKSKKYISSAYGLAGGIVISVLILGNLIIPHIDWNEIFNISTDYVSYKVMQQVVLIVFIGIVLQFVLKLVVSILYAMQLSAIPNLLTLISSIALLLFLLLADSQGVEKNIIMLAKAHVIITSFPLIITTIIIFTTKLKDTVPSIKHFEKNYAADVMKLGGAFFWLQIMSLIITSTNEFLISSLAGNEKVVYYQIYNKLFLLISTLFNLALIPIWSAVTKAYSQKDYVWLQKLYRILKIGAMIGIVIMFLLIPILQLIVDLWLHDNAIVVDNIISLVFALSGSIFIWHGVITSIINGIGKLKIQLVWLSIGALLKIPIAFVLYNVTENWVSIIIANIIVLVPYIIIQTIWLNRYLNEKGE